MSSPPPLDVDIDFGNYYALIIGNNDYEHLPDLRTARTDAREIATILSEKYGFRVKVKTDANRDEILDEMMNYRKMLTERDNLLIYYAGHGWLDEENQRGYWLPVDARSDYNADWVPNSDVTDALKAMSARRILIVADSCYAGTLMRSVEPRLGGLDSPGWYRSIAIKVSRNVLTSGGLEPVADGGGGQHSVFAKALLDVLRSFVESSEILDGHSLFDEVRKRVLARTADQVPLYTLIPLRPSVHDKAKRRAAWQMRRFCTRSGTRSASSHSTDQRS